MSPSPEPLPTIAILGAGSMGRAILAGILEPHVSLFGRVRVTNRQLESSRRFDDEDRVMAFTTGSNPLANREAVSGAHLVILAVKPGMIRELLDDIADSLDPHAVVISVAAGITTAAIESALPGGQPVVRAMPNTPATVGRAVTGICAGRRSSVEALNLAVSVFETVGRVVVVDEAHIDVVGAISGSGPAYVYYFIEQFVNVAVERGIARRDAELMVHGTFRGAIELLDRSNEQPVDLRRQVTSPGGSTERAIAEFDSGELPVLLARAVDAAIARQREMGRS